MTLPDLNISISRFYPFRRKKMVGDEKWYEKIPIRERSGKAMISMPQIQSIRSRRRNGESIASIARSEKVSEPTVRKYLRVDDL